MIVKGITVCIKYSVFVANFFVCIAGLALIGFGSYWDYSNKKYVEFFSSKLFTVPVLLIVLGIFLFLAGFFGCWGAIRESTTFLYVFIGIISCVIMVQFICGIIAFMYNVEIQTAILRNALKKLIQYNQTEDVAEMWDRIQKYFDCCGAYNATDWVFINVIRRRIPDAIFPDYFNPMGAISEDDVLDEDERKQTLNIVNKTYLLHMYAEAINITNLPLYSKLPKSCCHSNVDSCSINRVENRRLDGCVDQASLWIEEHIIIIGGFVVCLGLLEVLGIVFSCFLAFSVRDEASDEAKKTPSI